MLFNSYEFLLLFLPAALVGFYLIGERGHHRAAVAWLVVMSLFFYSWWKVEYLALIIVSILFNFCVGLLLDGRRGTEDQGRRRLLLIAGIGANLGLLGYFKYAGFLTTNISDLL